MATGSPNSISGNGLAKLSPVEGIKESSRQLRGGIAAELASDSDHFSDQDKQLLKFHGSYQQEDRDARKHRSREGVGKHYMFMVRCRIPGGRLTATLLAHHLAPRSRAYHEIWLNGKPVGDPPGAADLEPLYGKVYLPRKFKTGIALPEDNCIDVYAQDLGLLAIVEQGRVAGYNV